MTSSIIPPLQNYYTVSQQQQDNRSPYCTLQWRRGQLLVKPPGQVKQPYLSSLDKEQSLVQCLKHSPISLVRIDPKLGEYWLKFWAEACEQASKPIFLRIPSAPALPKHGSPLSRSLQRLVDWISALVFLLAVSPIMLGLILLMRVYSPGSLFEREWRVGERGKLFRALQFRTTAVNKKTLGDEAIANFSGLADTEDERNMSPIGRWMRRYGLHNLPQLLNVLRGEMSLLGPRCWTLEDAVRLCSERQRPLNKLPGITGSWEVEAQSNQLHLDSQTL